jgi:eukaryotic-like serine/threonine-protein kinase
LRLRSSSLPPPARIDGRYEVVEPIDEGGDSYVLLAIDHQDGRRVAIKMLKPRFIDDAGARERMRLEGEVGRRIRHPHVVRVLGSGEHDDLPYLVLELIEGPSLHELVRQRGPLPPSIALELVRQASCGLSVMHGRGVVHRDVKPGNVLVAMNADRPERAKIADLGFAHANRQPREEATSVGTLAYMSPEQALAERVDARTDVYGLGVTLFYALTGELPFEGDPRQLLSHQLLSAPPPASWLVGGLNPAIDRILRTALRKVPANRYPDMTALRDDLERALYMRSGAPKGAKKRVSPDRYRPASELGRQVLERLSACCA